MSEYIPTTEEVRNRYLSEVFPEDEAEFDRWLAQIKAEAWDEGFDAGVDHSVHGNFVYNQYKEYSEKAQKYIQQRLWDQDETNR